MKYIINVNANNNYQGWIESDWIRNGLTSLVRLNESALSDPWCQTALAHDHHQMLGCVAGEFYRRVFDSKSDLFRLARGRGKGYQDTKDFISHNAKLWEKVWLMLERMESMGQLPLPPQMLISALSLSKRAITPLWFLTLVLDEELLTPWVDYLPPDRSVGFEALRKHQQIVNGKLTDLENPFENSNTRLFIDRAIATAEKFDMFQKNLYTPMVGQREKVTNFMVKHGFKAFDLNGKQSRQGRR